MITKEKITIYQRFKGNIDGWARVGTAEEKSMINDDDWFLIESFVQDIGLIKKGLASETLATSVENNLIKRCDSHETIDLLKEIGESEES